MKKVTIWKPDTCECQLLLEWDTDQDEKDRVHTAIESYVNDRGEEFKAIRCSTHQIKDIKNHHSEINEENTHKNKSIAHVTELHSNIDPKKVNFHFDHTRTLHLDLGNMVQKSDKSSLQESIKTKFGRNIKVV